MFKYMKEKPICSEKNEKFPFKLVYDTDTDWKIFLFTIIKVNTVWLLVYTCLINYEQVC